MLFYVRQKTNETLPEGCEVKAVRMFFEEGLFVRLSYGSAAVAALHGAKELEECVIVTIFPDAGYKYLSTEVLWNGE